MTYLPLLEIYIFQKQLSNIFLGLEYLVSISIYLTVWTSQGSAGVWRWGVGATSRWAGNLQLVGCRTQTVGKRIGDYEVVKVQSMIYEKDRGLLNWTSLDQNCLFSVDQKFHFQLIKFFETFHLIKKFDQVPKKSLRILAVDQKF